jgi:gluconolactonase
MRRFAVADDATLSGGEVFSVCQNGFYDGFRLDEAGRIWTSAGDGVHVLDPDGTLLGKVLVPEIVANVAFGGPKRNRLFICATTSLYAVLLPVRGLDTIGA